jgi:WD40 repeat protein
MSAVFSPDGKSVLSASETLLIWDARTGAVLKKLLPLREAAGQSSGWSGDTDPKDATAWNNWIKRWESVTHAAQINTKGWHRSFAFYSPDGTQVVGATSEWLAEVWNVGTGLPIHILQNDAATWDAQFSPDARYVVSASADGAALLWAVKASEPNSPLITKLAGHESAVKAIAFSPSGAQLATAAANGTVRIWNIAHCQTAIDRAHEMLPREMSDHESYEYFLSKKTASTATDIFAKVRPWLAFALPAAGDACEW